MTRLRVWIMPTYAGPRTGKLFFSNIEPFLNSHPDLSIDLHVTTWTNAFPQLQHALKQGNGPDLFQTGTTWIGTLHHLGFLTPPPSDLEDRPTLAPWIDEIAECQKVRFCIPWLTECSCLQVRSDILKNTGIKLDDLRNWDGFLKVCQQIGNSAKRKGEKISPERPLPIALSIRPDHGMFRNISPWFWAGGWQIPDLNAPPIYLLSSESAQPALAFMSRLLQTNPFGKNLSAIEPYLIEDLFFNEGRFAFYVGYSWSFVRKATHGFPITRHQWPVQAIPFPSGPAGSFTTGGGSVLAVSSQCQHPDLAWELAQYLISDPFMENWVQLSGNVPAHEGVFWDKYADSSDIAFIRNQIKLARTYPNHPLWRSLETTLYKGLAQLLWRFLQEKPFDEEARKLLLSTDKKINSILELAWDGEGR